MSVSLHNFVFHHHPHFLSTWLLTCLDRIYLLGTVENSLPSPLEKNVSSQQQLLDPPLLLPLLILFLKIHTCQGCLENHGFLSVQKNLLVAPPVSLLTPLTVTNSPRANPALKPTSCFSNRRWGKILSVSLRVFIQAFWNLDVVTGCSNSFTADIYFSNTALAFKDCISPYWLYITSLAHALLDRPPKSLWPLHCHNSFL